MGEKPEELQMLDQIIAGVVVKYDEAEQIIIDIEGVSEEQKERLKKVLQLFLDKHKKRDT